MTKYGKNQKWNVCSQTRAMLRGVFAELGVVPSSPSPKLDLYALADGACLGVFEDESPLDPERARKGAWLELAVDDPDATATALEKAGASRIEYFDKEHHYFQVGASPVFRLARV
jgi:hypothetical protein